jgi:hypothetical protein
MKRVFAPVLIVSLLSLGACSGLDDKQQRVLTGGALGAAGGALIGALAGSAAIGAAVGGIGGAAIGGLTRSDQVRIDPRPQQ